MTEQPMICQNCGAEMEPGRQTRSRYTVWTEYICPNGCPSQEVGRPRGYKPKPVVPKTKTDAESFADDLLAELVGNEEMPEDTLDEPIIDENAAAKTLVAKVVADEDLVTQDVDEVMKVEDKDD